jgi:hypothetical protein
MRNGTELLDMANRLRAIAGAGTTVNAGSSPYDVATTLLGIRRHRDAVIGSGYFGEPSWDILLDLFVNEQKGRPISATSACLAGGVPPTTALRHLVRLTTDGLICSTPDPADARRRYISLTRKSREMMHFVLSGQS